jgi:hypothetical protein
VPGPPDISAGLDADRRLSYWPVQSPSGGKARGVTGRESLGPCDRRILGGCKIATSVTLGSAVSSRMGSAGCTQPVSKLMARPALNGPVAANDVDTHDRGDTGHGLRRIDQRRPRCHSCTHAPRVWRAARRGPLGRAATLRSCHFGRDGRPSWSSERVNRTSVRGRSIPADCA